MNKKQINLLLSNIIRETSQLLEDEEEEGSTNLPTTLKSKRAPVTYGIPDKREWIITEIIPGKNRGMEVVIIAGRMKDQPDQQVINGYIRFMDVVPEKPLGKSQFVKAIEKFLIPAFLLKFVKELKTER
jgi:hypothetical protein